MLEDTPAQFRHKNQKKRKKQKNKTIIINEVKIENDGKMVRGCPSLSATHFDFQYIYKNVPENVHDFAKKIVSLYQ